MSVIAEAERSDSEGWKQFVKFCTIGASSAVLDVGISRLLIEKCGVVWPAASTLSFVVAVSNGYLWNSLWTFRGMGAASRHLQYLKFVAVNAVGFFLNILIMGTIIFLLTGIVGGTPSRPIWALAKGTAIVLVAIWNFMANKRWTFAAPRA
ncbi:MAG: putative rane protein [Chthonomonadaceae bacterium]|nr:putative rane protein [Chthonomonadaceae bacterium]